jgi:hypothetical protein
VANAIVGIVEHGSADQINQLLTSYKTAVKADETSASKRDTRARRSAAVKGGRSSVKPPKRPDKNDFDAAWDSF